MYVIEVIPLTILPPQVPQILSYFFERELIRGALVSVPLGSRSVKAVVVSSSSLEQQKVSVKKSSFQLKKLTEVLDEEPVTGSAQLSIALWLSRFYFAPLGLCLKTFLPPFFGKKKYRLAWPNISTDKKEIKKPLIILSRAKDTALNILPLIQEALKSGQVALITPELQTVRHFAAVFSDLKPVQVHSSMPNASYFKAAKSTAEGETKLIIGTRAALFLPFKDLKLIIVDDPLNETYKSEMSPKFNTPDVAQKVARTFGARTVYVTPCLNAEARHWIDRNEYELRDVTKNTGPVPVITDIAQEIKTGNFSLFSRTLQEEILSALKNKKRVLLYSARRAYSSKLLCRNCGTMTLCSNCNIPMRVHKAALAGTVSETLLVCYRCSAWRSAPNRCQNCQSSELKPTGFAGSQKIKEHLERLLDGRGLDKTGIFILDSDLVRTAEQEKELFKEIASSPQTVVIATSMIFSHRYELGFDLIGAMNADAMLSSPDFRTEERFLYQLKRLQDFGPEKMFIQTFDPAQRILNVTANNTREKLFDDELAARKALGYPPFSRLVKLTFRHSDKTKASYNARQLAERLKMAVARLGLNEKASILGPSPALIAREKNAYAYNIILKLTLDKPDAILKFVPSGWSIDVDPRSII